MGTIVAETLINKAQIQLHDQTGTRFDTDELLGWLNDGLSESANLKPDLFAQDEVVTLAAGSRQELAAGRFQLVDVVRNMGSDGATPGRAITRQERALFDSARPDWPSETQTEAVKHWMYDIRDPKGFYVYPPADGVGQIEIVNAVAPSAIEEDAVVPIDDILAPALIDYMLSRAYAKDTDAAANGEQAMLHLQRFVTALQGREAQEQADNPAPRGRVRR